MPLSATGFVKVTLVVQSQEDRNYSHRDLTKRQPKGVHTHETGTNATIKGQCDHDPTSGTPSVLIRLRINSSCTIPHQATQTPPSVATVVLLQTKIAQHMLEWGLLTLCLSFY